METTSFERDKMAERCRKQFFRHGKTKTKVHNIWLSMRNRCLYYFSTLVRSKCVQYLN